MSYVLSARSMKNLNGVNANLVRVVRHALELTPIDFVVIEGLRTMKRQQELVAAGASQTMNSRHITGHAVDLAAWGGEIRWDMGLYYQIAAAMQKASRLTAVKRLEVSAFECSRCGLSVETQGATARRAWALACPSCSACRVCWGTRCS